IDDMNPQIYGHLSDRLLEEGALDVFLTPVYMKKGRAGTLLSVLCKKGKKGQLTDMIFRETTTLGVRFYSVERECLARREEVVKTPYGRVRVKIASRGREVLTVQPEYDECQRIAESRKVPLRLVMEAAKEAYRLKKK
ncbi:MAG: DUF111 family protein, partial [Zetaproteobacteria bacterium]|nr:DUF111 family protein [Zetaproteobacteria bacterium]